MLDCTDPQVATAVTGKRHMHRDCRTTRVWPTCGFVPTVTFSMRPSSRTCWNAGASLTWAVCRRGQDFVAFAPPQSDLGFARPQLPGVSTHHASQSGSVQMVEWEFDMAVE